ncbi:hypothetical protein evm_005992 [Chilo suppressalis]|nr:hypothetical protein evm_005992 [Chilo suppressalis]
MSSGASCYEGHRIERLLIHQQNEMTMESPVRICFSAALVINLLLLSSTVVSNALPHDTNSTSLKSERNTRYGRANNTTWLANNDAKSPDTSLNELNPKDVSEEHTEKNAKYKDRGRVRYNSQVKSSTERTLRRVKSTTEKPDVIIVTPTPEVKKPAEIIDSMRKYKSTKIPVIVTSSTSTSTTTTPAPVKTISVKVESEEEEYEDEEEEDDKSLEKYTSSKLFDSNFFTIPSYDDEYSPYTKHDSREKKGKKEFGQEPFGEFSTYFPNESSYEPKEHDSYKSESFFDFDTELTTPKNDFFDKKFREISKSIETKLASITTKAPPSNATNVYKFVNENSGLESLGNNTPTNKSTVIIKNTKEIRLLDNEEAGSANKALSDVKGTSIYYEMSVLSTETYAINHLNDDDCDNDTLASDPTMRTSAEEELASIKATQATIIPAVTKPAYPDPTSEKISTQSSNYFPSSLIPSVFSSASSVPHSTQRIETSTDNSVKVYSSSFTRNRSYSKRLNLSDSKHSPNSVTSRPVTSTTYYNNRQQTRRFHHTTPKMKPIWMTPRRNATRVTRPSRPTTIYSEHFDISDKFTTARPSQANKTVLTTVSSDIDPVLQTDIGGVKKVVHSPSISDNSIPSLWKRGSTKYTTSTSTSSEQTALGDLEIPPTLTAWALASLRSPPSVSSSVVNTTVSTHKNLDENELQKVGEVVEKKESTAIPISLSTSLINNDIVPKKVTEINQNRLPWRPIPPTLPTIEIVSQTTKRIETKYEKQPAESNISVQNSDKTFSTTDKVRTKADDLALNTIKYTRPTWVSATEVEKPSTEESHKTSQKAIPPVDATKSTGFESITKLPGGVTTPLDDTIQSSDEKNEIVTDKPPKESLTTDYQITTIRFSYVPTEPTTDSDYDKFNESTTEVSWHPVVPTRTVITTTDNNPITTYRPKFTTTDDITEETTTIVPETPPPVEVSSQIIESTTEQIPETTEAFTQTTTEEATTEMLTTTMAVSTEPTTTIKLTTQTQEETTSIVTEIITEINTEREMPSSTEISYRTEISSSATESTESDYTSEEDSNSHEVITQQAKTTTEETTMYQEVTTPKMFTTEVHVETTTTEKAKETTTEKVIQTTTEHSAKIFESTTNNNADVETTTDSTTEDGSKSVSDLEDLTSYAGDMTTEAVPRGPLDSDSGSGAGVAIAVSTIGVIALVLLIGLLLVVRRRGRRGVYAQRCTPVSLDAYSLDSVSVGHRKGNHRLRASKRSYGNPAYDDEVTSHPMQYAALANFAMDIESMSAEFAEIPSVTVRPDEVPPGCEDKNRYSNVLPLPETRVPLKRIGNDPATEYINANYVTGPGNIRNYYIACQAPLPNTVIDFWRMIWEQNSRLIVMLTEYMENGVEKCYEYLPPSEVSDNKRTFGDFQIILKKREQRDKYAISSVQLINLATRTWREVTQLWYFWPAKGVPDDYDSVIDFLSEMRSYMKVSQTAKEYDEDGVEVIYGDQNRSSFGNLSKLRSEEGSGGAGGYSPARAEAALRRAPAHNGTLARMKAASELEGVRPCVVVCASGAGRSAALIAADVSTRALAAAAADLPRVVRELRAQRPHALANRHHYIFLYKLLSEYGNKLMGGGVDTI